MRVGGRRTADASGLRQLERGPGCMGTVKIRKEIRNRTRNNVEKAKSGRDSRKLKQNKEGNSGIMPQFRKTNGEGLKKRSRTKATAASCAF